MNTINDVFRLTGSELGKKHLRHAREQLAAAEHAALETGKEGMWRRYLMQQTQRLPELLDIDLAKIIANAWNKHQELRKYGDQSKYKPTETIEVALVDHKIKSSHKPHIDFIVNGVKKGELKFDVKLTLAVSGLELKIRAGRIRTLTLASCCGSGEILLHGMRIVKEKTRKLNLSGEFSFGEGIPIGTFGT